MLESDSPYRAPDIKSDPRFRGWWPAAHPAMGSFLGVPIAARGRVLGAFYLTDKEGAAEFSVADQELIEMLAPHAAVAMENAWLHERSRELSIVEERNRLARDLHDSLVQKLFGVRLAAQSASTLLERDPGEARAEVDRVGELAQDAIAELRSLVFQLRPAAIEAEGLAAALSKHVEVLRRVHRTELEIELVGEPRLRPGVDEEVFRIAQEALHNAMRHSQAGRVAVRVEENGERLRTVGQRRRRRLRSGRGGAAHADPRADLDGGAGARARRAARDRLRSLAGERGSIWSFRRDPRAHRRRPRGGPPGAAHVPRAAGRHRGGRRRRRWLGRRGRGCRTRARMSC